MEESHRQHFPLSVAQESERSRCYILNNINADTSISNDRQFTSGNSEDMDRKCAKNNVSIVNSCSITLASK